MTDILLRAVYTFDLMKNTVKNSIISTVSSTTMEVSQFVHSKKDLFSVGSAILGTVILYNIFIPLPTLSSNYAYAPEITEVEAYEGYVGLPESEPADWQVTRSYWSQVTVYNSVPEQTQGDPFITASGERVRDGIIAANCLPFGTRLRMPDMYGDKIFVVKDRLAADKSCYILDIWREQIEGSKSFGAPTTKIEIIEMASTS